MKEAAGEANLTVVAIILIAVVVAVATPLINSLMKNASKRSCCTDAGGVWQGGICASGGSSGYSQSDCKTCMKDGKGDPSKCSADYKGQDPMGGKYHPPTS